MLEEFPITRKWPARNPRAIQHYALPTPNGIKASAMLEESGLEYEPHYVSFATDDQKTPEFLSLNPNGKIPAILDPDGPDGRPLGLWESGAILLYLADKSGRLIPQDAAGRYECMQWLFFQVGGVGPMFGQFGHFHKFARDEVTDPYPRERYRDETRRLLGVLEERLDGREFLLGDEYSIADIATWPWVRTLGGYYAAGEELGLDAFGRVNEWLARCAGRPASIKAIDTPAKDDA